MDYRSGTNNGSERLPNEAVESVDGQVFADFPTVFIVAFEELVGCVCKNIAKCNHVAPCYELWGDKSEALANFVSVAEISYSGVSVEVYRLVVWRYFTVSLGSFWRLHHHSFIGAREAWLLIERRKRREVNTLWTGTLVSHNVCAVLKLVRCWVICKHKCSILSLDLSFHDLLFKEGYLVSLYTRVNWGWYESSKERFRLLSLSQLVNLIIRKFFGLRFEMQILEIVDDVIITGEFIINYKSKIL